MCQYCDGDMPFNFQALKENYSDLKTKYDRAIEALKQIELGKGSDELDNPKVVKVVLKTCTELATNCLDFLGIERKNVEGR